MYKTDIDEIIEKQCIIRWLRRWANCEYEDFDYEVLDNINDNDKKIDYLVTYFKSKGETRDKILMRFAMAIRNGEWIKNGKIPRNREDINKKI